MAFHRIKMLKEVILALLVVVMTDAAPSTTTPRWRMIFRVTAGSTISPYYLWKSSLTMNANDPDQMTTTDEPKGAYKSALVNSWSGFSEVKLSFYTKGEEVAYVVFGASKDKMSWIAKDNIRYSSYSDIIRGPHNLFSLVGGTNRHFAMNSVWNGCHSDKDWMMVQDFPLNPRELWTCSFDVHNPLLLPQFLYSDVRDPLRPLKRLVGYPDKGDFKKADVMAVFALVKDS